MISSVLDPGDVEADGLLNTEIGNPCPSHPSDHYSIGYEVQLRHPNINESIQRLWKVPEQTAIWGKTNGSQSMQVVITPDLTFQMTL